MPRWTKALIELYTPDGFKGHWEGSPSPTRGGWDPADLPRLARRIRDTMGYADALIEYCEDGDTLVIGLFEEVEPPAKPKRGVRFVPDAFEEHM